MFDVEPLRLALIDGAPGAPEATRALLSAGAGSAGVLRGAFLPAVDEIAARLKEGSCAVPDVVRSAGTLRSCLEVVLPEVRERPLGVVVIGTPKGELHDLGKTVTALLLRAAGFEVHDVGTDVVPQAFVDGVVEHHATLLVMSGLLTTTVPGMRRVIEELVRAGLRERVKVLVGGTGVRRDAAQRIGADAGCATVAAAVERAWALSGVSL